MQERSRIPPSPPPFPPWLILFPLRMPRHHTPPISAHGVVVPPLPDNVNCIDSGPRFSFPQQVQPVPLDVLSSPLSSSCLQKKEIFQNVPVNHSSSCCQRWRCCHPKARSVCQPDGSLIFHGLLPMQSFSGEKLDIDCIW